MTAPLYGFDTTMFVIHPIELFDDTSTAAEPSRKELTEYGMWDSNMDIPNAQLLGLTIGNLRGTYISGLLRDIVIREMTEEGRKDYLPDAYKEFFDGNNFFVWNREKVGRYLKESCDYTIGANFISVEGLLQQMNLHIACILRTNTNSDEEWTERVQLVCSQQDI
ncbi:MAG: hypothetical protein GY737_24845, partial [Desulfobacteraceae bacterium]|nr:hypothetical protein [Desulfobacteraceae bacterium]